MKKIIFLIFPFLLIFSVYIYGGNEGGNGLYLLIEDANLRPIETISATKNSDFNQLLATYNVYGFKKSYPTLSGNDYVIKSSNDEKLKEELLLQFGNDISYAKTYSFGLEIGIEDRNMLPVEERHYSITRNSEFNQLLDKYEVAVFEQAFPSAVTESLQKTYMIKSPYQDELKEELLVRYRESIPLVEEMPGEAVLASDPIYTPNDYYFLGEHAGSHLELIRAREAWTITKDILPKVKVAITDTDFDPDHEDLSFELAPGITYNPNVNGHGTLVASCVGATTDNGKGIASIGGFNTELYVSTTRNDAEVLRLAKLGYRVINCSWISSCTYSSTLETLYREIRDVWNTVVVAAAGNSDECGGRYAKVYPASYDACVSVTSVGHTYDVGTVIPPDDVGTEIPPNGEFEWKDCHENIIGDSTSTHHHNDAVNICAPGYSITCATMDGGYANVWGTSVASPIVAGVTALIIAVNPNLTASEVIDILLSTADASIYSIPENAPYIGKLGTGRVDAYAAVQAAKAALPHVDLFIRDNDGDTGVEPNPSSNITTSPDIKLVDLYGTEITDLSKYTSPTCKIRVNIKNIGNVDLTGDEMLHLFWDELALVSNQVQLSPSEQLGLDIQPIYISPYICTRITPVDGLPLKYLNHLNQTVTPVDGDVQFDLPDNVHSQQLVSAAFSIPITTAYTEWGFRIIAVADEKNGTTPDFSGNNILFINDMTKLARNYNSIAMSDGMHTLYSQDYNDVFAVVPALNTPFSIRVNQLPTDHNFVLSDFAEVNVLLSNDLMAKLDIRKSGVKKVNENAVLLSSADTELFFNPVTDENGLYFAGAEVHFISDKMPELNEFDFDMSLATDGELDQSMRITAVRDESVYFKAHAETATPRIVKTKENVTLTANQISPDAKYIWHNQAGDVIGEGEQITLTQDVSQTYQIEVEEIDNGFKSYDEVDVIAVDGVIKSLAPNPANNYVTVSYLLSDNATDAVIQISDMYGNISASYPLLTTQTEKQIPLSGLIPGTYLVKLLISGTVVDSKQFLKQ